MEGSNPSKNETNKVTPSDQREKEVRVDFGGKQSGDNNGTPDTDNPKDEFRSDARIWGLYLKEANEQAKAQAELWKTGLESLLLFAGLFAGVVASFLIETRRKLQLEDQEFLLQDIRNALRNRPPPDQADYKPTTPTVWINGLWFASLLITLFSAILGVLARSWLVNYVPVKTQQEGSDAYQRWMLDQRTEKWKMENVITVIPLLVQLAFFLFAAGLGILVFNDHQTIGSVILGAIGLGTLVYLLVTAFPLFLPTDSCPFQTPLSDILLEVQKLVVWLLSPDLRNSKKLSVPLPLTSPNRVDQANTLVKIWCDKLIKSSKPDHVDEAIAELTMNTLTDDRIKTFTESDTPNISLTRLKSCMNLEYQDLPKRDDIMANNLLALSKFIAYSESINYSDEDLNETLHHSLDRECPLSRWNFFTEPVRPLALSVRIPILLEFKQDVEKAEVDEHPWERLSSSLRLQPKHRVRFLLSACRALVAGTENLKRISSFSIVFCMAFALKDGYKSEWGSLEEKEAEAKKLSQVYLARLFSEIARGWEKGPMEYLAIDSAANVHEPELQIDSSGLPATLTAALVHPKCKYRQQAAGSVVSLAKEDGDVYTNAVRNSIPYLIRMAISDEDAGVRDSAASALYKLGNDEAHCEHLKQSFPKILEEKLGSFYDQDRQKALDLLLSLTNAPVFQEVFKSTMKTLVTTALRQSEGGIQSSAIKLIEALAINGGVQESLEDATKNAILDAMNSESWLTRYYALKHMIPKVVSLYIDFKSALFQGESFERVMHPIVTPLVTVAVKDSDSDVREAGHAALQLLLKTQLPDEIDTAIFSQLRDATLTVLSPGVYWQAQVIVIKLIRGLQADSGQSRFEELAKSIIPKVSEVVLNEDDDDVRVAGLTLFEDLVEANLANIIASSLPPDLNQYKGFEWESRMHLIQLLEKLNLKGERRDGLGYIMRLTVSDDDPDVCNAGLKSLLSLCNSDYAVTGEIQDSLKEALPSTFDLTTSGDVERESLGLVKVLFYLMRNGSIRDYCCTTLQSGLDRTAQGPQERATDKHIDSQEQVSKTGIDRACSLLARLSREKDVQLPIRTAALETLHHMLHEQGIELAWNWFHKLAKDLLAETESDMALPYLTLMTKAVSNSKYEFGDVARLVPIVTNETRATELRRQSLEVLEAIGRKERGAGGIVKSLKSHLATITAADDYLVRMAWARVLGTLSRNADFVDGISQLVVMAIKDRDSDVRRAALDALAELAGQTAKKHSDTIWNGTELSKNLDSLSANSSWLERQALGRLLLSLAKHATNFELGRQRLIDFVVEDDDIDVRETAYGGLEKLTEDKKGQEVIGIKLMKTFEIALRHPHRDRRSQAIENLQSDYFKDKFKFGEVLKGLIGVLLKVALSDESDFVREASEYLLIKMKDHHLAQDIEPALLTAIASSVAMLTEKGKSVVLRLIESMPCDKIPEDVVSVTARTVSQLFKHTYGPTRMSAVEILPLLLKKGLPDHFIQSNIPDLVALALDDSHEDIRIAALNFLINLCDNETFRLKINTAQPRLMALLENRYLRSTTVELISLLSEDRSVRRSVASWIIASVTADANAQLEGVMELLSSLVIDQRFGESPQGSDYILLFLASALVLKPSMAKFRSRLTTSLWCNYKGLTKRAKENPAIIPDSLVNSFVLAIFGRHVTSYELKEWMNMQSYLLPQDVKEADKS